MAYSELVKMYCQNKQCRETCEKNSLNGSRVTDLVCPSCGFKTLKDFDLRGITEKFINEAETHNHRKRVRRDTLTGQWYVHRKEMIRSGRFDWVVESGPYPTKKEAEDLIND